MVEFSPPRKERVAPVLLIWVRGKGNPKILKSKRAKRYLPGLGLGRDPQGPPEFPEYPVHYRTFGLGYRPNK